MITVHLLYPWVALLVRDQARGRLGRRGRGAAGIARRHITFDALDARMLSRTSTTSYAPQGVG